jgi:hypothetical protein
MLRPVDVFNKSICDVLRFKILEANSKYYIFRLSNTIKEEILFYIEIYEKIPSKLLLSNDTKKDIPNFIKTIKYLIKYKYLLNAYKIYSITIPHTINYYYENFMCYVENAYINNLIIYNEKNICNHTNFILSIIFKKEFIDKKLLDYEILLVNGHFLLNKIIHAYNNPNRLLCQLRFEKNFNLFYNENKLL